MIRVCLLKSVRVCSSVQIELDISCLSAVIRVHLHACMSSM